MKVKELIKALSERPQDVEVFYLGNEDGLCEIGNVSTALSGNDDAKEITGDEFVILQ